uniref:cGMP-dependent protein kinase n=1 Tax=Alexandrium monilatum TaxID=311494 RepID=A0A7S4RK42_9DINO
MAPTGSGEAAEIASDDGGDTGVDVPVNGKIPKRCKKHAIRGETNGVGDQHLPAHRVPRRRDEKTNAMIIAGIKQNRFCSTLDGKQVDAIVEALEYYSFEAGEAIVRQGDTGTYFFVVDAGTCEVSVSGSLVNTLSRGVAFGAIGLLHNCPRTATVTARDRCGVWAVNGNIFRKVMKGYAASHHAESRQFLDHFRLFDGLSPKQKGRISELALVAECFGPGARVVTEGEAPSAMYFVRRGELSVVRGGRVDDSGAFKGGEKVSNLCAGSCFGERAALSGEPHDATVIADVDCELVCVGISELREALGGDLASCLERSLVLGVLKALPVVSHLSQPQHQRIAEAMDVKSYDPGQEVESAPLLVVLEGEVRPQGGGKAALRRGQWRQDAELLQLMGEEAHVGEQEQRAEAEGGSTSSSNGLRGLTAGTDGARVAMLRREGLAGALRALGLCELGAGEAKVIDYMRKVLLARKVPIFSQLSREQIDNVANLLVLRRYSKGAQVFKKGEIGSAFFVIASGEMSVLLDGKHIRTLHKGTYFGERALLFDEFRSATVEVVSATAELWSLDQHAFRQVITEPMRAELVRRIQLQDGDFPLKSLKHVRLIGAGSFGSVRLVENRHTGLRYALKRVRKQDGCTPEEFSREWELLSDMDHPFVLHMVRTFETSSSVYILMELVTGGQLYEEVHERMGLLGRRQAQFYIASLVVILEALHNANIVYRDLKPENVMLDQRGYLKLVDFGLAKRLDEQLLRTYTLVGTPLYMAPEVIMGNGYGFGVDVWSLGVMMYEFVCGSMPFGEGLDNEHDILVAVLHEDLYFCERYADVAGKKLLQGLLNKDPQARLGAGVNGLEDVKSAKYFRVGVSGDLFSMILGREVTPPVVPEGEQYSRERELNEQVSLSDADDLGSENDGMDKPLAVFRKFDVNGDGKISRNELAKVLHGLDPSTFTEGAVSQLIGAADTNNDGYISFSEFLRWIASEDAEPVRMAVDSDLLGERRPADKPGSRRVKVPRA